MDLSTLIVAFTSALGGVALKSLLDFKAKKHEELFGKREVEYRALWKLTGGFPMRPPRDVSYDELLKFFKLLSKWYFEGGGIYLSSTAQLAFNDLQETVMRATEDEGNRPKVSGSDYRLILTTCSRLRRQLTSDLMSRSKVQQILGKKAEARVDSFNEDCRRRIWADRNQS